MFFLNMVDCPMYCLLMSTWNFLCWLGRGQCYSLGFCVGPLLASFMFKSYGWVVVASMILEPERA